MKITTLAMCIALTMLAACKKKELVQDPHQQPPPLPKCSYQNYTCNDETVLRTFTDELATVIDFYQYGEMKNRPNPHNNSLYFILTQKDAKGTINGTTNYPYPTDLIPCDLPDAFKKDSLLVKFSGQQKACFGVLSYPGHGTGKFGSKLIITKIDLVN